MGFIEEIVVDLLGEMLAECCGNVLTLSGLMLRQTASCWSKMRKGTGNDGR